MTSWPGRAARRLACSVGLHRAAHRQHRQHLVILMYHGLTDDVDQAARWWHLVHRSDFERQLQYLTDHYDVQPLDEALDSLWTGHLGDATACITFDDGYRNNLTIGLPTLQRFNVHATIYIATGMIGTTSRLWTIELDHAFATVDRASVDLSKLGLPVVSCADQRGRRRAFDMVVARLKQLSPADRTTALDELYKQMGHVPGSAAHDAFQMMDWDDVSTMDASPLIRFGGHTVNHEIVSRLDNDTVRREIRDSIDAVKQHVRSISGTFAYPNGGADDFDARAITAVRKAGCVGAVSTIEGLCKRNTARYGLKRIAVGSDTTFDQFRLLTSGLISDLRGMVSRGR
jgi:peptidoglycan/xylan/chitin deacetylase (PgdA/CDA1 family)